MIKCIFLFEDDNDDVMLFQEALENVAPDILLMVTNSGNNGLSILSPLENLPDLIVMDINMPGISGIQCLIEIKSNVRTKDIPVVMLSTSAHQTIMREAYQKGANYYLPKPTSFEMLKQEIKQLTTINWNHGPIVL